jgi:hypothetical protein
MRIFVSRVAISVGARRSGCRPQARWTVDPSRFHSGRNITGGGPDGRAEVTIVGAGVVYRPGRTESASDGFPQTRRLIGAQGFSSGPAERSTGHGQADPQRCVDKLLAGPNSFSGYPAPGSSSPGRRC